MAKKKQGNANRAAAKLPAGFTAVSAGGEFGAWHDFSANKVLQGKVVELGSFTGQYGKQRTMTVKTAKGNLASFSESRALQGLFDMGKAIKGKEVFIRFDGEKKLKGKKRVKLFTCAVK